MNNKEDPFLAMAHRLQCRCTSVYEAVIRAIPEDANNRSWRKLDVDLQPKIDTTTYDGWKRQYPDSLILMTFLAFEGGKKVRYSLVTRKLETIGVDSNLVFVENITVLQGDKDHGDLPADPASLATFFAQKLEAEVGPMTVPMIEQMLKPLPPPTPEPMFDGEFNFGFETDG